MPSSFPQIPSAVLLPAVPCALIFYLLFTIFFPRKVRSKGLSLPPGPFRWPLVGNVFDMPRAKEWITFAAWRKIYGK